MFPIVTGLLYLVQSKYFLKIPYRGPQSLIQTLAVRNVSKFRRSQILEKYHSIVLVLLNIYTFKSSQQQRVKTVFLQQNLGKTVLR